MQHIGIINYKNKIIYVDLKDNNLICYYYHNNEKRNIGINTVLELFKSIFDKTKEEFLEQDGEYNVFLNQETGYKHFYKDGKEDILKFFLTNGTNGTLYKGSDIKDKYLKVKQFVNKKANIGILLSLVLATAISSSAITNLVNQEEEVQEEIEELDVASLETEYNKYYDFDSLANAIKSPANVGNLSKDILYNEELIRDICNTPMSEDRIKSLEEVDYAILETSGKLSVFKRRDDKNRVYPLPIIIDGKIQKDVLYQIGKDSVWLEKALLKENYQLDDVFYGFYQKNRLFLIRKEAIK